MNPFEGYIGQEPLIKTLNNYLSLHTFPNVFFVAMKGSGKSEIARRIAKATNADPHEIGCKQNMKLDTILIRIAVKWRDSGILFFDELPLMSRGNQAALRTLTEDGHFFDSEGEAYDFPNLTVLGAGTDITKVDDDLIDRFDVMEFDPYSIDDLALIGQGFDTRFGTNLEYATIEKLALACDGSPRRLRKLIEHSAASLVSSGQKTTIDNILENARIDEDGMSSLERTLLRKMGDFISDGLSPTLSRLATSLRMKERALNPSLERLESFGYVSVSMGPGGRKLTPEGIRKLREIGF